MHLQGVYRGGARHVLGSSAFSADGELEALRAGGCGEGDLSWDWKAEGGEGRRRIWRRGEAEVRGEKEGVNNVVIAY